MPGEKGCDVLASQLLGYWFLGVETVGLVLGRFGIRFNIFDDLRWAK
jgi:hypothetical protein